jgi:dynein light intermediate chain 1
MFVVAMTTPWGILDQLQTWATVLQDHIDRLKIDVDDLQEARHKCKYYVFIIFLSLLSLYFECHFV